MMGIVFEGGAAEKALKRIITGRDRTRMTEGNLETKSTFFKCRSTKDANLLHQKYSGGASQDISDEQIRIGQMWCLHAVEISMWLTLRMQYSHLDPLNLN